MKLMLMLRSHAKYLETGKTGRKEEVRKYKVKIMEVERGEVRMREGFMKWREGGKRVG